MKEKLPKVLLIITLLLVLVNLGYLDYRFYQQNIPKEITEESGVDKTPTESSITTGCSSDCQQLVDQKIAAALTKIPTQKPATSLPSSAPVTLPTQSQTRVSYIPLMATATVNSPDWKDIIPSDFYFDLVDYSGVKNVRFEIYLKSQYQSGKVYVRLYDVTNKRAVDYSDLSSSSETFELQRSSDLTIWRGNNLYRLQSKTQSGLSGYLEQAKLKIIF